MWAAIFTTALAPAVNWLLVFKLHFGLDGAAYSTVFISVLQALVLLLLVIKRDRALSGGSLQTWHGWCDQPASCKFCSILCGIFI